MRAIVARCPTCGHDARALSSVRVTINSTTTRTTARTVASHEVATRAVASRVVASRAIAAVASRAAWSRIELVALAAILGLALLVPARAFANPRDVPAPVLADLAMPAGDDARKAIAIGPRGEVYEPDGKGAWVRDRAITVADAVAIVGRANGVVALAGGAVYRLADNGWSAMRLVQKGKAVMSGGARSVAAVGRQLFALDKLVGGEVAKLAMAPQPVQMIGAGAKALTIQTERGLLRAEGPGAAWKTIARAPRRVERLLDDRWALTDRGPVDLKTGNVTPWPAGFRVGAVTPGATGTLVIVGTAQRGAIEVVVIDGVKVNRETIDATTNANVDATAKPGARHDAANTANTPGDAKPDTAAKPGAANTRPDDANTKPDDAKTDDANTKPGNAKPEAASSPLGRPLAHPVGVVTDTSGRVVVAFRDGRMAIRDRGVWSVTTVSEALPAARPGAPPARSP